MSCGLFHDALAALPDNIDSKTKSIFYSAEGFCRWKPKQFCQLSEVMKDQDLHLVYIIRDPVDIFYSHWAEEVKQGRTTSLPVRFSDHFNDPFRSRLLNPLVDLMPLSRMKKAKLHILMYEQVKKSNQDIFQTLLQFVLGVTGIASAKTRRLNTSYPIALTEFLRLLTLRKADGEQQIGSSLRHAFINNTTPEERHAIVETVNAVAPIARRAIKVPRDTDFIRVLEKRIRNKLSAFVVPELGRESIFLQETAVMHYFDEYFLLKDPAVSELLDLHMARIEAAEQKPDDSQV